VDPSFACPGSARVLSGASFCVDVYMARGESCAVRICARGDCKPGAAVAWMLKRGATDPKPEQPCKSGCRGFSYTAQALNVSQAMAASISQGNSDNPSLEHPRCCVLAHCATSNSFVTTHERIPFNVDWQSALLMVGGLAFQRRRSGEAAFCWD
jgi:hypothetical protein